MNYQALGALQDGPVIVIRLKDPVGLARRESAIASLVTSLAPSAGGAALSPLVYQAVADKVKESFASEKPPVLADVTVIDGARVQTGGASAGSESSAFLEGAAVGAGGVGVLWVLWQVVKMLRR